MSPFRTAADCLASQGQMTPIVAGTVAGTVAADPDLVNATLPSAPPPQWWQRLGRTRNAAAVVPGGRQSLERPLGG